MEYWDVYDKNKIKKNKVIKRGDKLKKGEYHLVINAWIKNSKNEFLITQRAGNRSFPFMWECTGGSALKGENSIEAALREVNEELGIKLNKENAKLIGTTLRHYKDCSDILEVWMFDYDVSIENIVYQKEEICNAMWASPTKIKNLYKNKKFEANAFFEEIIEDFKKEKIYYIGFNANNAICNENFFDGSITIYPTNEKGNIYFSKKNLLNDKSDKFLEKYKNFIFKTVKKIQLQNKNSKFIFFNEKARKLCKNIDKSIIIKGNDHKILNILNNKFKTRKLVSDCVPILDYFWIKGAKINYKNIQKKLSCDQFVLQAEIGSGGDSTYLIDSQDKIDQYVNKNIKYCISKYIKNIPLNITIIIGEYGTIYFPISIQLILLTDNKFKYVGGDFIYSQKLNKKVINQIINYSKKITKKLKENGYRGILGIDYILCDKNKIFFMEINPRFQASSFLINKSLEKNFNTSLANLHYLAIKKEKLEKLDIKTIDFCFLNCNNKQKFSNFNSCFNVYNGYCEKNLNSIYRKTFDHSIFLEADFEKK